MRYAEDWAAGRCGNCKRTDVKIVNAPVCDPENGPSPDDVPDFDEMPVCEDCAYTENENQDEVDDAHKRIFDLMMIDPCSVVNLLCTLAVCDEIERLCKKGN